MRLTDLNEISRNVQKNIVCPRCQRSYAEDAVDVVDVIGQKGVFAAQCLSCGTATLIVMSVREFKQRIAQREKQKEKVQISTVSPADVVEISSFLNAFKGDFDKLLATSEQVDEKAEQAEDAKK